MRRPLPKVVPIEPRLMLAYGLILLLMAATVGGLLYMRHNRPANRNSRDRKRDMDRHEARER